MLIIFLFLFHLYFFFLHFPFWELRVRVSVISHCYTLHDAVTVTVTCHTGKRMLYICIIYADLKANTWLFRIG